MTKVCCETTNVDTILFITQSGDFNFVPNKPNKTRTQLQERGLFSHETSLHDIFRKRTHIQTERHTNTHSEIIIEIVLMYFVYF